MINPLTGCTPVFLALDTCLTRIVRGVGVALAVFAHGTVMVMIMGAVITPTAIVGMPGVAFAQSCPEEPPLQNYTGGGTVACPCFVQGEQAGAVLQAPAAHYPLEILRVGVGWGSQYGGNPQSLEEAIHIYEGGFPNPGTPIFTQLGPQLTDGVINVFDFEPIPGEIAISSGPFTVTLQFFNQNAGNIFASSVVHDGNGCQPGKNAVFAIPGGWKDACALGVTGDWVFFVVYRPCTVTGIGDTHVVSTVPAYLMPPQPNPFGSTTQLEFLLAEPGPARVSVFDVTGRRVAQLADEVYAAGTHYVAWDGLGTGGAPLPSGMYFVQLQAGSQKSVRKVLLAK